MIDSYFIAGGMVGADIALSWVDQNGRVYIQVMMKNFQIKDMY